MRYAFPPPDCVEARGPGLPRQLPSTKWPAAKPTTGGVVMPRVRASPAIENAGRAP